MRIEGSFLRSKVARRIVWFFILSALLPIAATVLLSFGQVRHQLLEQGHARLRQTSESFAASVRDRLLAAEHSVEDVAATIRAERRARRFGSPAIAAPVQGDRDRRRLRAPPVALRRAHRDSVSGRRPRQSTRGRRRRPRQRAGLAQRRQRLRPACLRSGASAGGENSRRARPGISVGRRDVLAGDDRPVRRRRAEHTAVLFRRIRSDGGVAARRSDCATPPTGASHSIRRARPTLPTIASCFSKSRFDAQRVDGHRHPARVGCHRADRLPSNRSSFRWRGSRCWS